MGFPKLAHCQGIALDGRVPPDVALSVDPDLRHVPGSFQFRENGFMFVSGPVEQIRHGLCDHLTASEFADNRAASPAGSPATVSVFATLMPKA